MRKNVDIGVFWGADLIGEVEILIRIVCDVIIAIKGCFSMPYFICFVRLSVET